MTDASCAACPFQANERACTKIEGRAPERCPTRDCAGLNEAALREYEGELGEFARDAALQEAACYAPSPFDPKKRAPVKPRILEIIEFCKRRGYSRLGLAFCIGLREEAKRLEKVLISHGFEVVSAVCKVGCIDKSAVGLKEDEKIYGGHESMCNPVGQAMILNEAKTEFNLMLGLCVGHDSMFLMYSDAPVTVVAVKDRLLGHNPLAALYTSYYAYLEAPKDGK